MKSGWIGPGKAVEQFEAMICEHTGAAHCVVTTSGTTALLLALHAILVRPPTDVGFPAYTYLAGANVARLLYRDVRLVDVSLARACMEIKDILPAPDSPPTWIYVDHNGYLATESISTLQELRHFVIEDACQAFGNSTAGTHGDIGVFSFSPQKMVTTGQGGAAITDNHYLATTIRELRDQGDCRKIGVHKAIGGNFRMPDVLAAWGVEQMKRLPETLEKKARLREWYRSELPWQIGPDEWTPEIADSHDWWLPVVRSKRAKKLVAHLASCGIEAKMLYRPVAENPPYKADQKFPNAEMVADTWVYLPGHLGLKRRQVKYIAECVQRFAGQERVK
jgi:perosamine synthetase